MTYEGGTSLSDYSIGGHASGSRHDWFQLTGHWTEANWVQGSGSGSGYWEYASGDDSSASNFSDYDSYYVPGYFTEFYGGSYYPGNYSQGCRGEFDYSLDMGSYSADTGSGVFSIFDGLEAEWSLIDGGPTLAQDPQSTESVSVASGPQASTQRFTARGVPGVFSIPSSRPTPARACRAPLTTRRAIWPR